MAELYNRDFTLLLQSDEGKVRIGSNTIDGAKNQILKIEFEVERDSKPTANSAKITIYNLTRDTRALISSRNVQTILDAGYAGFSKTIFKGLLDYGSTVRDGANWITTFESTDGGKALRSSRINISFKPGVSLREAIEKAADAMGVGLGNVAEKAAQGNIRGALQEFGNGLVLSGSAKDEFSKLMRLAGYDWSIQDGQLQVLGPNDAVDAGDTISLSEKTGLVGSPQPGEKGLVTTRSLLIPDLVPGRVVRLESNELKGFYRIDKTVFSGDSVGQAWYADLDLKPR